MENKTLERIREEKLLARAEASGDVVAIARHKKRVEAHISVADNKNAAVNDANSTIAALNERIAALEANQA